MGIFNSSYWKHSEMAEGETDNKGSIALMVKRRKCIQYQSPTCSIMSTYWECWDMMSLRSNLTPVIICSSNSVFMDWLATVLYTGLRNSWAVLIVWWGKRQIIALWGEPSTLFNIKFVHRLTGNCFAHRSMKLLGCIDCLVENTTNFDECEKELRRRWGNVYSLCD